MHSLNHFPLPPPPPRTSQHVYRKWSALEMDNEEQEKQRLERVAPAIIDDAKMGWRTLAGQQELAKEVGPGLRVPTPAPL